MARTPLISSLAVLAAVAFGLRCAFVPGPQAVEAPQQSPAQLLQGAAITSGAFLAAAAPAVAEEVDGAEAYSRKVFTGAAYCLALSAFLLGLIISQGRKLVENKWLN
eukprot:CAMPEP_0204542440 /NCGR_PEP_ID=MMETSP0661-20131031/18970_1 /ASSEMBLY_ACC=CAM_ASM_000606 /TAXON_ID=109239 /ORGANISM="Alexandrium margalefi, Strain AMGDE01CS-322" /LENGTH=106 /DNA_ID=CAMNT_0051549145 /DNA_START=51 /DNA_END=371 /DNA_ORIENTATION=+